MLSRSLKNILRESFYMAIDAIRQNKLRSTLTLIGISIGVFSVIGVMTAIRTLESSVASGLNEGPDYGWGWSSWQGLARPHALVDPKATQGP